MVRIDDKLGDITLFYGDAIINSVGVDTIEYGGICRSILEAARSDELKRILSDINGFYSVGSTFVTSGYALPVDKIIHVITPLAEQDEDYDLYRECCTNVLNECKKRNLKKVGFPLIGTGANKFNRQKAIEVILSVCNQFDDLDISLVLPNPEISKNNRERLNSRINADGRYHSDEVQKLFKKGAKNYSTSLEHQSDFSDIDVKIDFEKERAITDLDSYIRTYLKAKYGGELDIEKDDGDLEKFKKLLISNVKTYFAVGKSKKSGVGKAGNSSFYDFAYGEKVNKNGLFRVAFALKMTYNDACCMLNFFGYTFCTHGIYKEDDAVADLLKKKEYGIVEIENEFKKRKIKSMFWNNDKK